MISEFFLDIGFNIVSSLFEMLPDFTWSVDTSSFQYFVSVLKIAGYMLPWDTVGGICGLIFGLSIFRIVIALIKTLWNLLPFA